MGNSALFKISLQKVPSTYKDQLSPVDNGDSRWCSVCQGMEMPGRGESQAQTAGPSLRHTQAGHDHDHDDDDHDDDDGSQHC